MNDKLLSGIRVLEISQFISGPRTGQLLADLGAEVIKIEPPIGETLRILHRLLPHGERAFSVFNRNKKGMTLNFRSPQGIEIFKKLVARADIVIENFTPGTMESMKIGYEELKKVNPRIILASISGFGQTGPNREKTAFDLIAQATGGIMHALRHPDEPPGVLFGDLISGAYGAVTVLAALFNRGMTGQGRHIDISMQDVMYYHNFRALSRRALEPHLEEVDAAIGRTPNMLVQDRKQMPFWNSFKARDGYVAIVALTEKQWSKLVKVMGREDLLQDERLSNLIARVANSELAIHVVTEWTAQRTVTEIVKTMDENRIPCGPVLDYKQVNTDPQLESRGMYQTVNHPEYGEIGVPGIPFHISDAELEVENPAPGLGEHNEEILASLLGYTPETIAKLKEEGII